MHYLQPKQIIIYEEIIMKKDEEPNVELDNRYWAHNFRKTVSTIIERTKSVYSNKGKLTLLAPKHYF